MIAHQPSTIRSADRIRALDADRARHDPQTHDDPVEKFRMIRNDLSLWPLVLSVSRGAPTFEELQSFSADWEGWLDRGERFATLRVYADVASHTYPEGGAQEKKRWFQANGARLKTLVVAMASVVPSDILDDVRRIDAEKLFGVPVQTFAQIDPTNQWIGAWFAEQGLVANLENVGATLTGLMVD